MSNYLFLNTPPIPLPRPPLPPSPSSLYPTLSIPQKTFSPFFLSPMSLFTFFFSLFYNFLTLPSFSSFLPLPPPTLLPFVISVLSIYLMIFFLTFLLLHLSVSSSSVFTLSLSLPHFFPLFPFHFSFCHRPLSVSVSHIPLHTLAFSPCQSVNYHDHHSLFSRDLNLKSSDQSCGLSIRANQPDCHSRTFFEVIHVLKTAKLAIRN